MGGWGRIMEPCAEHSSLMKSLGRIEQQCTTAADFSEKLDKRINGAFDRISRHIEEGEKPGGHRERLLKLEQIVDALCKETMNSTKQAQWRIGVIAGMPGAILAVIQIIRLFSR